MLVSLAQIHASTRQKYQHDCDKNKIKYFSKFLFVFPLRETGFLEVETWRDLKPFVILRSDAMEFF